MPKIEIGEDLYLFKTDPNAFQSDLIISSHGGIKAKESADLTVPYGTLHYYTEHGKVLKNPTVRGQADKIKKREETETVQQGAKTYNYHLSKFQGAKNQGGRFFPDPLKRYETYETIEEDIAYLAEAHEVYGTVKCDVLTVRDHKGLKNPMGSEVTLQHVLTTIGFRHKYDQIHCCFCRSF